jgi:hypothetical protein
MDNYRDDTYGENIASVYDEWYDEYGDVTVTTLRELARGGRAPQPVKEHSSSPPSTCMLPAAFGRPVATYGMVTHP